MDLLEKQHDKMLIQPFRLASMFVKSLGHPYGRTKYFFPNITICLYILF